MGWDRKLWGVEFFDVRDRLPILGTTWGGTGSSQYEGEPTRALLFSSRAAARGWCAKERAKYAERIDSCRHWRFRPIRVRERISALAAWNGAQ